VAKGFFELFSSVRIEFLAEGSEWGRGGHNSPPNPCEGCRKVPIMSQVLSSIQYVCSRKASFSNMGAPNLLLALDAI